MFNMGFTEMILLAVLALIFVGPKQLPQVARTLGRVFNEFKRATSEFTHSMDSMQSTSKEFLKDIDDDLQRSQAKLDIQRNEQSISIQRPTSDDHENLTNAESKKEQEDT